MKDQATLTANPGLLFKQAKELMDSSPEEALTMLTQAQNIATQKSDHALVCEILIFLSRYFRFRGKAYESAEKLNMAYRLLNRHIPDNRYLLAYIYKEFGSLYSDGFHDYAAALNYSLKSLQLNVEEFRPHLYNNIGSHYINLKDFDKAISYLTKGQQICEDVEEVFILCYILENFGNLYIEQKKYSEAMEYFRKGLAACEHAQTLNRYKQPLNYIKGYIQIGLANVYFHLGDYEKCNSWIQAIEKTALSKNLSNALSHAHLLKGELYLKENRTQEFEDLFKNSLTFCKEKSFYNEVNIWLERIIELYEDQERYAEALSYSKMIIANKEDQETKTEAINVSKVLEHKEMEILELENRNRSVKLQNEQLEQFAYIVAHDLKTPLSNISNFIGLFSRKYREQVDVDHQFYLDFVLENSKRLHKMLDELLRYITVKKSDGDLPQCNVQQMLIQFTKNYANQINEKNALVEFTDLPIVNIHPFHLEIILDNLIRNALKFSRKQETPRVLIEAKENKIEYQFSVSDNGIGIKKEYHHKIFDVFKQLDKVNYKGTGMGLSICKKIIQIYGGKIRVSDNDWGGTSFHFNIPKIEAVA